MKISFCVFPEGLESSCVIEEFLENALQTSGEMERISSETELEVVLTNDEEIHKLNLAYRGKDRPTDVLSFSWAEAEETFPGESELLGEIIISLDTAKRQAEEYRHSFERELAFLGIHGFLHLIGYDHELGEEEEERMMIRQEQILNSLNILREGQP